jgi:hypothetical protein
MRGLALLLIGLASSTGPAEYARQLGASSFDQETLDAEGYGEKKFFKREADGLRVTLPPGDPETGWKIPPQLRFGGDFTVSADFVVKKLPKPAQEDGAAIGVAIAFGDINQPDVTLVRLLEPKGGDVYRAIEKAGGGGPMPMPGPMMGMRMNVMMMGQPAAKNAKPPRRTFPASGDAVHMEITREGQVIRLQVRDAGSARLRYIGQFSLGPNDVASVKLFASNRNGAEAVDVLFKGLSIRADRINGLGTIVRTVYGQVVYGDPTAIEAGMLVVGGPPKAPPGAPPKTQPAPGTAPATKSAASPAAASPTPGAAAPAAAAAAAPLQAAPAQVVVAVAPGGGQAVMVRAAPAGAAIAPGSPVTMAASQPAQAGSPTPAPAQPAKPRAKVPFDELDSIRFERTPTLSARFLGQPNLDFTMPGLSAKNQPSAPAGDAKKPDATPKKDAAKPGASAKKDAGKPGASAQKDAGKPGATPKKEAANAEAAPKKEAAKAEVKKDAPAEVKPKEQPAVAKATTKDAQTKQTGKTAKAQEKKADEADDPLAPPPGTTITKIAKVEPKKNGIRDLHIGLFGLRNAKIQQITVNCQTDKGPAMWRLDTSNSQDWPIFIRRSGTGISADLFLEPPTADCFQKDFQISLNYADGQAANTTAKAAEHTKPDLAVDPKAPAVPPVGAWIYLIGDDKLFGTIETVGSESLKLTTPWRDHLDVPLARVAGIQIGVPEPKESAESFAKRLKERGSEDLLLAQTKKGEVIAIPGIVEGTEKDRLRFRYQGRTRTIPLELVEGLVLAGRPESQGAGPLRPTFTLSSGLVISGSWKDLDTSTWKAETEWGQALNLPASEIETVRFRSGKMTYLSDLKPSKVEEIPFFGHRFPWRRDVNLLGAPLKMSGQTFERGLAVHSRCVLTYDLDGKYATFEALVGFDDASGGRGRVDCRVLADGKEIYANRDLRADRPPEKLALSVAGAQELRVSVDYGPDADTGDRLILANARLYHKAEPKPKAATPAAATAAPAKPAGAPASAKDSSAKRK